MDRTLNPAGGQRLLGQCVRMVMCVYVFLSDVFRLLLIEEAITLLVTKQQK